MLTSKTLLLHSFFVFLLCGLLTVSADALTFTVNSIGNSSDANTSDNICAAAGGVCTLRAAIQQANASTGADAINFDAAVFGAAQTITLTSSGLPEITDNLTVTGTSPGLLLIDGTENVRPFTIASGVTVSITNLSVIRGYIGESSGGCVYNAGNLTLTNVVVRNCEVILGGGGGIANATGGVLTLGGSIVRDNSVLGFGGGIDNNGTLNISGSSIYGNSASAFGSGGGINNNSGATVTITDSTVRDNQTENDGGGIANDSGTVNITRSTVGSATPVGSNRADNSGGGIYNLDGTVNLTNSTVSGNFAVNFGGGYYGFSDLGTANLTSAQATIANNIAGQSGGGIAFSSALSISTGNINNTIIGDNIAGTSGADVFSSLVAGVGGTVVSGGYNLIENTSGANFIALATDQTPADPRLLPLALNGGTTETHALQINGFVSPAIDKGNAAVSGQTTDQRGLPIYDFPNIPNALGGNGKDIGAFEAQAPPTAASVNVSGRVMSRSGKGIARARVSLTDSNGVTRLAMTNFFGYYRFAEVAIGETYVFDINSKFRSFDSQVVTINEELTELNFIVDF